MKYKVILDGFETEKEALDFADWFVNGDTEAFEFEDGSFPTAVEAYQNKPLQIIDNTVTIEIEKYYDDGTEI